MDNENLPSGIPLGELITSPLTPINKISLALKKSNSRPSNLNLKIIENKIKIPRTEYKNDPKFFV